VPYDLQVLLQAIALLLKKCEMLKICTLLFVFFGVDENNANDGANMAKTSYKWKCCFKHFHFFPCFFFVFAMKSLCNVLIFGMNVRG
jgi:hypothetical protein